MRKPCLLASAVLLVPLLNASAFAYTLTVDGTTDVIDGNTSSPAALAANPGPDGKISLLEAVEAFDNAPQPSNLIAFNIPPTDGGYDPAEGIWRIKPRWPIAPLSGGALTIDGATQTASQGDTNPDGPEIVVDGSLLPAGVPGFVITSAGNVIAGLGIHNFSSSENVSGVMISWLSNTIGPGNEFRSNASAIIMQSSTSASNTVRGDSFFSNGTALRILNNSSNNTVTDNLIDGCTGDGIIIGGDSNNNIIGPENIIRGSGGAGIYIADRASEGNTITQNSIHDSASDGIYAEGITTVLPFIFGVLSGNIAIGISGPGTRIEFFADDGGEGETYLGDAGADANGIFLMPLPTTDVAQITATFTDAWGTTGPFCDHYPPYLYVCNTGTEESPGDSVTVINAATNETVSTITVGSMPKGIAVGPSASVASLPTFGKCRRLIAVANNGSNSVSLLSAASNRVLQTYAIGEKPLGVRFSDNFLYVSNRGDDPQNEAGSVTVIDTRADRVVEALGAGKGPNYGIVYAPLFNMVGVSNILSGTISVFQEAAIPFSLGALRAGDSPSDFRLATDLGSLIVANFGNGRTDSLKKVSAPSGRTRASIFTGYGPTSLDLSGPSALVANSLSDTVSFVRMSDFAVEKTIPVGKGPDRMLAQGPHRAYVSNFFESDGGNPGTVSVLDIPTARVIDTITVGSYPTGLALTDSVYSPVWPGGTWIPPERNTLHLALLPGVTLLGPVFSRVELLYIIDTEASGAADVCLGVRFPNGREQWFDRGFRRLVSADSVSAIPRIARNFAYGGFRYGVLTFNVPGGLPPGYYCLMTKVLRPGTDRVIITLYSNYLGLGAGAPG